jgi:asparagine synthase (glutamine-hydrolysing)
MCGIAGYIALQKLNGAGMLSALHHRGPDHNAAFSEEAFGAHVYLGHTRLSILDLSANGNQPMFSDDRQVWIVFNGEIYNFPELKKKFLPGRLFRSDTDTEVILQLYLEKGISCLSELNGDFAIAIYDRRAGKLFLVRDRAGVKPLYYYHDADRFIFASEIKSILAAGVQAELDEDEVSNYFVFKYSPQNRTLFKNIRRLEPASVLTFSLEGKRFTISPYWTLRKNKATEELSYEDAKAELSGLIEDSTRMRLLADVPIGNFLSGGLDSSIIAHFLRARTDIVHYCARKDEHDLRKEGTTSDYYYASRLAGDWNLDLRAAPIGSDEASSEMIRTTLRYSDDLIADGSQIPAYLITREAARTSKVILSGMGADELFLGYAGHMLTLLDAQLLGRMPSFLSGAISNRAARVNQGKGKFLAYRRYIHKLGKYSRLPRHRFALYNIVGDFENSASVFAGNTDETISLLNGYFPEGTDIFDSLLHFELQNFLVKNLHYTDRMAMANSVECRVPFLDHRIIEFAYSIPRHYKLTLDGRFKRILKDAFASHLPRYVVSRRKAGFGMPLRSIFSDRAHIDRLLDRSFFANFNKFSGEHIARVTDRHLAGAEDNSSIIYALVSFQEWYKLNFS